MATDDVTRSIHDRRTRYAGVRMQQGRVLTDDDFNATGQIQEEERRRSILEVVGPHGSPDAGFAIADPDIGGGSIDFTIHAGIYFIGGLAVTLHEDQSFRHQTDWLQNPGVAVPSGERTDLVYLDVWQQSVSAVEDSELFEVALGGPDTTTRRRTMARVRVRGGIGIEDCRDAWDALAAEWADDGLGMLDEAQELVPDSRLAITYGAGGDPDDLCNPSAAAGYLGAENQAIPVQLIDDGHFTWGFDNGAPLYRATIAADRRTLTLQTDPKDEAHWPAAGQVVELLPWGAVLPNGEKLAEETAPGHLSRIEGSYDPDTRRFTLTTPAAAGFGETWTARDDADELRTTRFGTVGPQTPYLFVRIWDRGADRTSPPRIPIVAAAPLGTTGLLATFSGADRPPGTHWIVAARPNTPDRVSPWELDVPGGRLPHGPRRFLAPLGLLRWHDGSAAVEDCRPRFRPLTHIRGCCRVTVGDGRESRGDFATIQAAIDSLPPDGGEVCVLPGIHEGLVRIDGRVGVTVHGCGARSILIAPADAEDGVALLTVLDSRRTTLRELRLEAPERVAVQFQDGSEAASGALQQIRLERLAIFAGPAGGILGLGGRDVEILDCTLLGLPGESSEGAVRHLLAITADDVRIVGNRILGDSDKPEALVVGGLQIGGGSDRVEIRGNEILGGAGNGITLGSVRYGPAEAVDNPDFWMKHYLSGHTGLVLTGTIGIDEKGCLTFNPNPPPPGGDNPDDPPLVPISDGDLTDLRILDNHIAAMGGSGIAVVRFFDPAGAAPDLVGIERLQIEGNRIEGNLRVETVPPPPSLRYFSAVGGIVLARVEDLLLRNNRVADNGATRLDPVCGVFVLAGEGLQMDGNRITGNGMRAEPAAPTSAGRRGGIVVPLAMPSTILLQGNLQGAPVLRQNGTPTLRVNNNIVVAPEGRALQVVGVGPMSITANQLTTHGSNSLNRMQMAGGTSTNPQSALLWGVAGGFLEADRENGGLLNALVDALGGGVVSVLNFGVSNEIYLQIAGLSSMIASGLLGGTAGLASDGPRLLAGGNVQFNDNQVTYDALGRAASWSLSAATLISLDDISIADNQFDCDLMLEDLVITNLLTFAWSVRVADNRMKEGLVNAFLSILSFGLMNATTGNQTTHCYIASGLAALTETGHNRVLLEAFLGEAACSRLRGGEAAMNDKYFRR